MAIALLKELPKWESLPACSRPREFRSYAVRFQITTTTLLRFALNVGVESVFGNERFPLRQPS